jgi:hypothetical protein
MGNKRLIAGDKKLDYHVENDYLSLTELLVHLHINLLMHDNDQNEQHY